MGQKDLSFPVSDQALKPRNMAEVENREPFVGDVEPTESEVASKARDDGLQALEGEDRLRLFHLKAILVSGIGFFTDAYDLQVIACVKPMMAMAMWPGKVPAIRGCAIFSHKACFSLNG